MSMFEKASRAKLRFDTSKGLLSVEDLWDLPLSSDTGKANLDDIARGLFAELQGTANISFVIKEQKADDGTQLQFDVVKHIIDVRLVEADAKAVAKANKEKKQRLLAIIENKELEQLGASSLEDLKKMADAL